MKTQIEFTPDQHVGGHVGKAEAIPVSYIGIGGNGAHIGRAVITGLISEKEAWANARLWASAPALLEALKACEEALAEVPCLSNKQESSRVQARAAISQAEGRGV